MPQWLEVRLAWRNVWRNGRRTALTSAATVFAVFLVALSLCMSAGTHRKMVEDGVRLGSGHVTISGRGYLENQTLEQSLSLDAELERLLDTTEGIMGWGARVSSFALLSHGDRSDGVAVLGVDPAREGSVSSLVQRVSSGRFLTSQRPREIVLGAALARDLRARIGDELLLYGVAYSLETAYELFTVVGIVRLPMPDLERALALVSLRDAQEFFVYGDRVSEVAILARNARGGEEVLARLTSALAEMGADQIELHGWAEHMPDLEQFVLLDRGGMFLQLSILIVVVGFGILNTILMSVLERTRELGVMRALGLSPAAVFRIVYFESAILSAVGLVIGLALSIPCALYFEANPIPLGGDMAAMTELLGMEPVIVFDFELSQLGSVSLMIGVVALLAAAYPAFKAGRARPVDALRSL
jgi:putative ABC transport system permease protein